jgi:tRNA-specific 2-thiouridylase
VDSSVAAYLLRRQGYAVVGAMMKLFEGESSCCSAEDAEDARAVAARLDIPFHVFNFTDTFERDVIARFVAAYAEGTTPNPCIDCNRFLKFERFFRRAAEMDCEYIATGHYARICEENGRFLLKKGVDAAKDQSYVLYAMTQNQLARTLLPLGGLTKHEVREIAAEQGFINAKKRDSQDICFAPDGDYAGFIARHTGVAHAEGDFIAQDGGVYGRHRGIAHYTIGQRKGLGISAPHPLFVTAIDAAANTVTLGASDALFAKTLRARDINILVADALHSDTPCTAKIRYSHSPAPAVLRRTGADEITVTFDQPVRAITPGQAVVCYDGDTVICGGTIGGSFRNIAAEMSS